MRVIAEPSASDALSETTRDETRTRRQTETSFEGIVRATRSHHSFGSFDLCFFFPFVSNHQNPFPFLSRTFPFSLFSSPFGSTTTRNLIHHSTNPRTETLDNRSTMSARRTTIQTASSQVDKDRVANLWRLPGISPLPPGNLAGRLS